MARSLKMLCLTAASICLGVFAATAMEHGGPAPTNGGLGEDCAATTGRVLCI